ncbi:hypothetical protein [Mucilaginibacter sp. SP1R1]|uniref:hypothetical protein n=1 Tax=Mucilaginibacter sp. SP1R1 TaxID=2723091 RepID=UPI00160ABC3E|nr:hypothetical protein [Mucilaginibacter sp. SP1R1]MBB6149271.1 hypothetical protein [Mucilaginibacter sp. SP1R1]
MRSIVILLFVILGYTSAQAQKWQPGNFTDVKGNREAGLIRVNPPGKGPIKNEGFIEFKENEKANPYKLSTSDVQSFVAGRDSFVVAHAPNNESWSKEETDFVKVVLDEPTKLYMAKGGKNGGGSGIGISPGVGVGYGSGGYGGGLGGGLGITLGGGGRNGGSTTYYYGANTADMERLTDQNFEDIMTEIMGDEPEVVEKIHAHQFNLKNIDKLIAYFNEKAAAQKK